MKISCKFVNNCKVYISSLFVEIYVKLRAGYLRFIVSQKDLINDELISPALVMSHYATIRQTHWQSRLTYS